MAWRLPAPEPCPGPPHSTPSPPGCSPASIPCMAASAAHRASRMRHCSAFSGRTPPAPAMMPAPRRSTPCCGASRWVASTTTSAVASPATRPTPNGWCRISRRCFTTTRRSSTCSPSRMRRVPIRSPRTVPRSWLAGSSARCWRPPMPPAVVRSHPRRTPTARARKAVSTSGPRPRSTPCSAPPAPPSRRPTTSARRATGRAGRCCAG